MAPFLLTPARARPPSGEWAAGGRVIRVTVADGQMDLSFCATVNTALLNPQVVVTDWPQAWQVHSKYTPPFSSAWRRIL